jgi:hypothetical protein
MPRTKISQHGIGGTILRAFLTSMKDNLISPSLQYTCPDNAFRQVLDFILPNLQRCLIVASGSRSKCYITAMHLAESYVDGPIFFLYGAISGGQFLISIAGTPCVLHTSWRLGSSRALCYNYFAVLSPVFCCAAARSILTLTPSLGLHGGPQARLVT